MKQIDCFNIHMKFWTIIGIWPGNINPRFYKYYSMLIVGTFIVIYNGLFTINFYFVEKNLNSVVEEMIFYFTEVACTSKVFTYLLLHDDIVKLLSLLESDIFQPRTHEGFKIVQNAKKLNVLYWKIYAGVCVTCYIAHVCSPVIAHVLLSAKLDLPICSYSFLSEHIKAIYNYPLYFYQGLGIHMTMWYDVNIDTFILGVMILTIAQLDILDEKLRTITDKTLIDTSNGEINSENITENEYSEKFNECIVHYDEISKFCTLIERIFSITIFVQFSMSAYIICVCLFRFTLPAIWRYYIFLGGYMTSMMLEVMVPCWFGTHLIEKSGSLGKAIYDCDWMIRPRRFKSNMRFFVLRTSRPLSINGWKMFPLSLKTFTAIMNSAYSVFALLRHMQGRQ